MRCGWKGTVEAFLGVERSDWLARLSQHYIQVTNELPAQSQSGAWENCFVILRDQFTDTTLREPSANKWGCLFEYELPREGGRRPDLVLLAGDAIIVLEFKEKQRPSQADVDQVMAYARDIANYHHLSHDRAVIPLLVPTEAKGGVERIGEARVVPPALLASVVVDESREHAQSQLTVDEWMAAPYEPLPFLVEAARFIFRHDPLPFIRRAYAEAQIPKVIGYLAHVAELARNRQERHLALVTGVPGAGKTLVGLQFVYEHSFGENSPGATGAVFLSGNGPLVDVLQHALRSRVFVQPMRNFIKEYGMRQGSTPAEHVLVFDEAQRAWSSDHVLRKHGVQASEPDMLVQIAERLPSWALLVGLIGEGQEIHIGEEAGLSQWNAALANGKGSWCVHTPPKLAKAFPAAGKVVEQPLLNLNTSLRSHVARDVQDWVRLELDGDIRSAASLAAAVRDQGFVIYVTRSLADAKAYARERYEGQPLKRYGLLASSKPGRSILDRLGVLRDFQTTQRLKVGPWYNDPPDSPLSCCQLETVATEFACQGLELDLPIVCWSDDLWWERGEWRSPPSPRSEAVNPHQLRLNSYRVLLSRGRDGVVVWVPEHQILTGVYETLVKSGVQMLPVGSLTP